MTVQELIDKLSNFKPDTEVVVPGYEDGYNPIGTMELIQLVTDEKHGWYEGPYKFPDWDEDGDARKDEGQVKLVLHRGSLG